MSNSNSDGIRKPVPHNDSGRGAFPKAAGWSVVLILILGAIGITGLSYRPARTFLIDAKCEDLRIGHGIDLQTNIALNSIHLTNFEGSIDRVGFLRFPGSAEANHFKTDVNLIFKNARDNPGAPPPSLRLRLRGTAGPTGLKVAQVLSIHVDDESTGTPDRISLTVGPGSVFTNQAGGYDVEQARYHLNTSHSDQALTAPPNFEVRSAAGLLVGTFMTPSDQGSAVGEKNKKDGSVLLVPASQSSDIGLLDPYGGSVEVGTIDLSLASCRSALIQIQGTPDVVVHNDSGDEANAFSSQAEEFKLDSLEVINPTRNRGHLVRIRGTGRSFSFLHNQRQLVPTFFEKLLDKKPEEVGLIGTALLFCIFAGGVFLKRSLEVLAKRWIPD